MAENVTLARPYAEAAFDLAKASNLAAWSNTLQCMAAITQTTEMEECISSPRISAQQLTDLFVGVVGNDVSAEQQNFVRILVDNERLAVLPEISILFDGLKSAYEDVKQVDVASAFPLDAAATAALVADLEAKFKSKINATVRVVPELIGGVRIAIGDEVIDASVSGKLAAMATALKN